MFAAVRINKNHVSYHFMPIYAGMGSQISPKLKRRMQGKACFNFAEVDRALFNELRTVTKRGYRARKMIEWVD